jgi:hypothetical protein
MIITTQAWYSPNVSAFHAHKTVFFQFVEHQRCNFEDVVKNRLGIAKPERVKGQHHINLSYANIAEYSSSDRAEIIVTDTPQELFGYIDMGFAQRNFKLVDLQENASGLGLTVTDWTSIKDLSNVDRGRLFASPLVRYCQRERKSEEAVLGYKRYSWEEFSRKFRVHINETDSNVCAFPATPVSTYGLSYNQNAPDMYLSIGQHDPQSDQDAIWIQRWEFADRVWENQDYGKVFPMDRIVTVSDEIARHSSYTRHLTVVEPTFSFANAPSLLRSIKYTHYFKETQFSLPQLQVYAKDLGIKGFSTKTKSELSIHIGEMIAELQPLDTTPAIIPTEIPTAIEELNFDHTLVQSAGRLKIADYYRFASRVISNAAYAPKAAASPAGRIPTDGNFPAWRAIEPLNIME